MATKTLKVPNKLSEITLGQYQQFSKISIENADEDFLQKKTIEIFCGVDLKDVDKIKYTSIVRVIGVINKMFSSKSIFKDRFKMNGIEYGFIPKLDNMTYGEFVDLDTLMNDWQTMDQAMAVMYRKLKDSHNDKYTIENYDADEVDDMKQMPLDIVFGAIFFLESLGKELTMHTLNYLAKDKKKINTQQRAILAKILDGGLPSTVWERETLPSLKT
tara:strand:- start:5485 stop:6132 length:648 start_codon:yes stop_codon:yes gene_type:complete